MDHRTIIIAEAGVDHEGQWSRLRSLFNIAAAAKVDAFKIQWYAEGFRGYNRELPFLSPDDVQKCARLCTEFNMLFICTPHDKWSFDQLVEMDICSAYKVGSGDWHLLPMLRKETDRPLIISTGMKTQVELNTLQRWVQPGDTILHCSSAYPTPPNEANLPYISTLAELFPKQWIGYSDHTMGIHIPIAAVCLGAQVIEKHICLSRDVKDRQDTFIALDYGGLCTLVQSIREVEYALIRRSKKITKGEQETLDWVKERNNKCSDL